METATCIKLILSGASENHQPSVTLMKWNTYKFLYGRTNVSKYVLSFKPSIGFYGFHDPSAALFRDGTLIFGAEEERYTRQKHAPGTFPDNAIRACLDYPVSN